MLGQMRPHRREIAMSIVFSSISGLLLLGPDTSWMPVAAFVLGVIVGPVALSLFSRTYSFLWAMLPFAVFGLCYVSIILAKYWGEWNVIVGAVTIATLAGLLWLLLTSGAVSLVRYLWEHRR